VKCGTIAKEKEELKDLEFTEKLTPQMLDDNQKKRLKELKNKYGNNKNKNDNQQREREREREHFELFQKTQYQIH